MTQLWALTATASDVDASGRAAIGGEFKKWIERGGAGVALITCHRAELYGLGAIPELGGTRTRVGRAATSHLMRVACGLESVIVGEDEVLHQVRDALQVAGMKSGLDRRLRRLFETAIAAGRTARSGRSQETGNLAGKAVAWLGSHGDISGRTIVVAGAGRMGAALAHSASSAGALVIIASRDVGNASRLADVYGARGVPLGAAADLARRAAGVAVALAGPWTELESVAAGDLPPVADISAPPAVPVSVRRRLNGGFLGIDDLYRQDVSPPKAYIEDARRLVALKAAEYEAWLARTGT
ncbi:MAG TPA: NAD(P)-binding domain-containing protein [Candidatus Dormibacteraeota bacterium]|nr:NAD(P)-binding domain-containing protein [Candidatus Dormibacteraeota bacterium]